MKRHESWLLTELHALFELDKVSVVGVPLYAVPFTVSTVNVTDVAPDGTTTFGRVRILVGGGTTIKNDTVACPEEAFVVGTGAGP